MKDELSKIYQAADLVKICKAEGVKIPKNDGKDYSDTQDGRRNLRKLIRDHRASLAAEAEKISDESPLGSALLGKRVGDKVEFEDDAEETRKGLPWWAWALIVAAVIFIGWLAFRPRQVVQADTNAIVASVETALKDDFSTINQNITDLAGRLTVLEQVPAEVETEAEAEAPADPVEEPVVEEPEDIVVEADQTFVFRGHVPAYSDFRVAVREPGDTATFDFYFEVELKGATIPRIWPDDVLVSATFLVPGKDPVDITNLFGMFFVPAGGTGDSELDKALQARGVNIAEGEILMQNKNVVALGDIPAGTHIVFEIKDNEELQVNRGIGVVIDTYVDAHTVSID